MTIISGYCYRLGHSERLPAQIQIHNVSIQLSWQEDGASHTANFNQAQARLSDAIGNVPQYLNCPNGMMFHASEPKQLQNALAEVNGKTWSSWVDQLERHKTWIAGAVVGTILFVVLFYKFAIPPLVAQISEALPTSMYRTMGQQTLTILNRMEVEASQVPADRQAQLTQRFDHYVNAHPQLFTKSKPQLLFREWSDVPNAVTLADGHVLITDELLKMLNDDQAYAVLLHELGHAHGNHVMRSTVRASLLSVGVAVLIGDASNIADTMVSAGTLALNMSYSRDMETEADAFAAHALIDEGIGVEPFVQAFEKLESTEPPEAQQNNKLKQMSDWFASHPDTQERIKQIRQIAAESQKK